LFKANLLARQLLLPAAALAAVATLAAGQPATPPVLYEIDRVGIIFTDLDPDVGAGRPTISAKVEWIEGPFYTPVLAGPGEETTYRSHLTIALSAASFYRWDGPPHLLPEYLPADINRDGVVDHHDYLALISAMGTSSDDLQLP